MRDRRPSIQLPRNRLLLLGLFCTAVLGCGAWLSTRAAGGGDAVAPVESAPTSTSASADLAEGAASSGTRTRPDLEGRAVSRSGAERAPRRVHAGRVIDAETGAGIPGVEVTIVAAWSWSSQFEGHTDSDGYYAIRAPIEIDSVRVSVPYGWRSERSRVDCRQRAVEHCQDLVFELERLTLAPLSGLVLDSNTGEPVPGCLVELSAGERVERVVADASGRFASVHEYEADEDLVLLRSGPENPPHPAYLSRDPVTGEISTRFRVGPTYPVALTAPPALDVDSLRAYLRPVGGDQGPPPESLTGAVRDGSPRWVRLPNAMSGALGSYELVLFSPGTHWYGTAPVENLHGVSSRLHRIDLVRGGGLVLEVTGPDGEPVGGASFSITNSDGELIGVRARSQDYGRYEWAVLRPGEYRVRIRSRRTGSRVEYVSVAGGVTTVRHVSLPPKPTNASIAGTVEFASGAVSERVRVLVESHDGTVLTSTRIVEDANEPNLGRFRLENLPVQSYEVRIADGNFVARPERVTVTPPVETLAFEVLDDAPATNLWMSVVDAETQEPLERWRVTYSIGSASPRRMDAVHASSAFLGPVPDDSELAWTVEAPAYASASGDRSSVVEARDGRARISVALRRIR